MKEIHRFRFMVEQNDRSIVRIEVDAHDSEDAERLAAAYANAFLDGAPYCFRSEEQEAA